MTPTNPKRPTLLARLGADEVLDSAYAWVCRARRRYPDQSDIWDLRHRWPRARTELKAELLAGRYRFSPLKRITRPDGEERDLWSACDALVLKALSLVLGPVLPVSRCCTHVKGHGGVAAALRRVRAGLQHNRFVLRTDVKDYYASVDHFRLLDQLAAVIHERALLNLLWQYLHRTLERGGLYQECTRGLPMGCSLSPLLGAFFLNGLDRRLERLGLTYVRYMDDIVVLSPTRWKLRRAVRELNETLAELGLTKHPGKTTIGRIAKGFDFLGAHFTPDGVRLAKATLDQFVARATRLCQALAWAERSEARVSLSLNPGYRGDAPAVARSTRLYEHEPGAPDKRSRLGGYVRHFSAWACGLGLSLPPSPGSEPWAVAAVRRSVTGRCLRW